MLEEAPVLGGERGLDEVIGYVLELDRVIVQDAALADLGAVAVDELHGVAAGRDLVFVEIVEGRYGQHVQHRESAGADGESLRHKLVENAFPACQAEAREEAGERVVAVLGLLPRGGDGGIDARIEA